MRFFILCLGLVPCPAAAALPVTSAAPRTTLRSKAVLEVREFLRQPIAPEQRTTYRGITKAAMTGTLYDQIINTNITTPEELIIAEMFGFRCHPSDDPEGRYLFSIGRGLIAKFSPRYVQVSIEGNGEPPIRKETISEMDAIYRGYNASDEYTPEELAVMIEETLDEVATDYVEWAKATFGEAMCHCQQDL
ncbi:hypothetical protein CC79DRAFT_1366601 [Sarocladium strictum]|jgi:hypothetical protein